MTFKRAALYPVIGLAVTTVISLTGCGGGDGGGSTAPHTVNGQSVVVNGATVSTWAKVDSNNVVTEAGATIPYSVIQNPPTNGTGPAGAFVALPFPNEVQSSTYINHVEIDWNPQGHPPARFQVPHFDFHFYAIPQTDVQNITPPDPNPPAADRIPAGYVYAGANQVVPQMGVHAVSTAEMQSTQPFTSTMVMGFYNGSMIFAEPMITQAYLEQKQNFTLDVPKPAVLGKATRYPTKFNAVYDAPTNSYQFTFTDFVTVTQ